jgi:hypothetical protein
LGRLVGVPAFEAFADSAGTTRIGALVDAASTAREELAVMDGKEEL